MSGIVDRKNAAFKEVIMVYPKGQIEARQSKTTITTRTGIMIATAAQEIVKGKENEKTIHNIKTSKFTCK